jgi:predicted transcriptional regulator
MAMKVVTIADEDQVLAAVRSAPLVEGTAEETAAFEEGLAAIRAGRTVSASQVRARLPARAKE